MNTHQNETITKQEAERLGIYQYQLKWLNDHSKLKVGLWSRQSGKDFTAALEAVLNCKAQKDAKWVIMGCSERQSLESMERVKSWADSLEQPYEEEEHRLSPQALLTAKEVRFPNGSKIVGLPSKPATARGYAANLILTEFAFHDDPEAIWEAIYPALSNPLRGGDKVLRVISTPNGIVNRFSDIWHKAGSFSKHKVTIAEAIAAGLPLDLEELRSGVGNEETWAQEYGCEFIDTHSVLLPYELLQACEDPGAATNISPALGGKTGEYYAGIDFGRSRDRTVCWTMERANGVLWTREVLVLEKMPVHEQAELLASRVERARLTCLDYTGGGIGLGDELVRRYGEHQLERFGSGRVELCQFTMALKSELYPRMRAAFEKRELRIPVNIEVREDLHAVHRVVTAQGNVLYRAPRAESGHSDRATALALALRAAQSAPAVVRAQVVNGRRGVGEYGRRQMAA